MSLHENAQVKSLLRKAQIMTHCQHKLTTPPWLQEMAGVRPQERLAKLPPKSEFPALPLPPPPPGTVPPSPLLSWASMLRGAPAATLKPRGIGWGPMWRMSIKWWSLSSTGASPVVGPLRHSPSGLRSPPQPRSAFLFCMHSLCGAMVLKFFMHCSPDMPPASPCRYSMNLQKRVGVRAVELQNQ